jgi:acyl dehydratase
MAINHDAVGAVDGPRERSWDHKDCLLYALGVGAGVADPTGFELEFTTENSEGVVQKVLPTMAVVLQAGGLSLGALGPFNLAMMLHGEQGVELHQDIPIEGRLSTTTTITGIYDKGAAAVVAMEAKTDLADTGAPLFTCRSTLFIRGEGGWGGDRGPSGPRNVAPDRAPDHQVTYRSREDQALLYRLNGDRNPLHSDPTFAAKGGFPKPILHGLCSYGFTGRGLLHELCGSDPSRFGSMEARFASPVMPGEALTVKMWDDGDSAIFRTCANDDRVVIDGGRFTYRG